MNHEGENRRRDEHWQTKIDGQIDELVTRLNQLESRVDSSSSAAESKMRDINHSLNNNTQITEGNAFTLRKVKEQVSDVCEKVSASAAQVEAIELKVTAAATHSARAVTLMENLTALNRVVEMCGNAVKWAVPITSAIAGIVIAIKSIFK